MPIIATFWGEGLGRSDRLSRIGCDLNRTIKASGGKRAERYRTTGQGAEAWAAARQLFVRTPH